MVDPEATGYIEWHLLPRLIQQLDEPLGFGTEHQASVKETNAFIGAFACYGVADERPQ